MDRVCSSAVSVIMVCITRIYDAIDPLYGSTIVYVDRYLIIQWYTLMCQCPCANTMSVSAVM